MPRNAFFAADKVVMSIEQNLVIATNHSVLYHWMGDDIFESAGPSRAPNPSPRLPRHPSPATARRPALSDLARATRAGGASVAVSPDARVHGIARHPAAALRVMAAGPASGRRPGAGTYRHRRRAH